MLFPSVLFLLYFLPAVLILYWVLDFSRAAQNVCLLLLSLLFYAWGEPLHLVPMLALIVVNHVTGRRMAACPDRMKKRTMARWTALFDICVLIVSLYGNTLAGVATGWLGIEVPALPTPPLGIAFFTLQAISYVFDIARGKARAENSIVNTGLFIAFFPTVLAGPILSFNDMAPQLHERKATLPQFGMGCERFIVGLAKVLLLATPLSRISEAVFNLSAAGNEVADTPVTLAFLGLIAYGLQLYMAFSGYADMAIGLGRMLGFSLPENFRHPYTAHTIREFWRRCNITLYRWFFVYIFLAMGGSRPKRVKIRGVPRRRNYVLRNLVVLWLLIGMWHGISWNHFFLGVWFFVFAFLEWVVSLQRKKTTHPAWCIYVLPVVAVSWVFLRCNNAGETLNFFSNLLGVNGNGFQSGLALALAAENWHILLAAAVLCTSVGAKLLDWLKADRNGVAGYCFAAIHLVVLAGLLGLSLVYLTRAGYVPFIFR